MVQNSQFVIIAVKPHLVLSVIEEVHQTIISGVHVIVSVANGITTSAFEQVPHTVKCRKLMRNIFTVKCGNFPTKISCEKFNTKAFSENLTCLMTLQI